MCDILNPINNGHIFFTVYFSEQPDLIVLGSVVAVVFIDLSLVILLTLEISRNHICSK